MHAETPLALLVVPFHDEVDAIDAFVATTLPILDSIQSSRFEIVCINDGRRDNSLDTLIGIAADDPCVRIVDLTRCFGKGAALTACLDGAAGEAAILLDADLRYPVRHDDSLYRDYLSCLHCRQSDDDAFPSSKYETPVWNLNERSRCVGGRRLVNRTTRYRPRIPD